MAGFNLKMAGKLIVGGAVTVIVGGFITPLLNQMITFIPQTAVLGVTIHSAIGYGIGYALAEWSVMKLKL